MPFPPAQHLFQDEPGTCSNVLLCSISTCFTKGTPSPCPLTKLVPDMRSRILFQFLTLSYCFLKTVISVPLILLVQRHGRHSAIIFFFLQRNLLTKKAANFHRTLPIQYATSHTTHQAVSWRSTTLPRALLTYLPIELSTFSLEGHSPRLHSSPPTNVTEYFYSFVHLQCITFLFLIDKASSERPPSSLHTSVPTPQRKQLTPPQLNRSSGCWFLSFPPAHGFTH